MWQRMWRAAKLDPAFYEMVEADPRYTREAFLVVLVVAVCSSLGMAIEYRDHVFAQIFTSIVVVFCLWVAWAGITLWVGTNITETSETRSDMGEMLRVLGYAFSPQILSVFYFVPGLGSPLVFIGFFWSLLAGVVAIRQALDFNTTRALITGFIGWVVMIAVWVALQFILL